MNRYPIVVALLVAVMATVSFAGDSEPGPTVRPKGYFQCYVPTCEPLEVFLDLQERTVIDIEIMLTARERDSGKEQSKVRAFTIDTSRTWKLTPESDNPLDRIRWYVREPGREWSETPTMECRCSYFGSSIEVFINGDKVDEYPNPNMP